MKLGNIALSLASVTAFLVICEIALWGIAPPPKPAFPKDMFRLENRLWGLQPDFKGVADNRVDYRGKIVTGDSRGLRIVPAAPSDAQIHLYAIGDSQTFGHGVSDDESWPNQLQLALGSGTKVVNMGVPSINVDQYVARMNQLGPHLRPGDVVMVGLSWNDLITPQNVEVNAIVDGYLVRGDVDVEAAKTSIKIYDTVGIAVPPLQSFKDVVEALAANSALMHNLYPRAKAVYYRYRSQSPLKALFDAKVPEANFVLLSRMKAMADDAGAKFVVVLLPDKIFFEDKAFAVYSVDGREFPEQNVMKWLAEPLCAQFAIRCLDAFPLLHAHQHDPVAFPIDGHYNERGTQLIGEWLAREL